MRAVLLSLALASARATELTSATWDSAVAGKSVFIKFLAPWWGHCKAMKPDWDKLMDEFKDSPGALVADVDCTGAGSSLCTKHDVSGYPTIKYGDPSDLQNYEGERNFEAMKQFASENLLPTCGPDNLDLCDDAEKKRIKKFQKMDVDELEMSIEEGDEKIKKVQEEAKKQMDKLEAKVKDLQEQMEKQKKKSAGKIADAGKKLGLKFMKLVAERRKGGPKEDEPKEAGEPKEVEPKEDEKKEEL